MASLTLLPSAHPSAWDASSAQVPAGVASEVFQRDRHTCRFCAYVSRRGNEIYFRDGDRLNQSNNNLLTACLLCCAVQNPLRAEAELEVLPIWLPELGQRALNKVVRGIHILRVRNHLGAPADISPKFDSPIARSTSAAFLLLAQRAVDLQKHTGLRSPGDYAALFLERDGLFGRCPDALAVGLRFLHRGRYYVSGRDVYSDLLKEDLRGSDQSVAA